MMKIFENKIVDYLLCIIINTSSRRMIERLSDLLRAYLQDQELNEKYNKNNILNRINNEK